MGTDRPGAGFARGPRSLKPPPDRLYGRARGHALRPRQRRLLDVTLPRLRFAPDQARDPRAAFAAPVDALWLEVGFGAGEHARALAARHPEAGLIACEVFENGIAAMLSALVPEGGEEDAELPPNLRLWPGDARDLLRRLPDASLDALFLMFPDPWPKARHAKRRFVHPALLPLVAHALRPGGLWRIATDDPVYQAWIAQVLDGQTLFEGAGPVETRPSDWPPTRYEAKAIREGRQPLYWALRRTSAGGLTVTDTGTGKLPGSTLTVNPS